jgi:hypothetical protein
MNNEKLHRARCLELEKIIPGRDIQEEKGACSAALEMLQKSVNTLEKTGGKSSGRQKKFLKEFDAAFSRLRKRIKSEFNK